MNSLISHSRWALQSNEPSFGRNGSVVLSQNLASVQVVFASMASVAWSSRVGGLLTAPATLVLVGQGAGLPVWARSWFRFLHQFVREPHGLLLYVDDGL